MLQLIAWFELPYATYIPVFIRMMNFSEALWRSGLSKDVEKSSITRLPKTFHEWLFSGFGQEDLAKLHLPVGKPSF